MLLNLDSHRRSLITDVYDVFVILDDVERIQQRCNLINYVLTVQRQFDLSVVGELGHVVPSLGAV
jgi:hypothetical protein